MDANEWAIDGRPFPHPVEPFGHIAGQIRERIAGLAPEARAQLGDVDETLAWLDYLGGRSGLATTNRIAVLALGEAAVDATKRAELRKGLDFIEDAIAALSEE